MITQQVSDEIDGRRARPASQHGATSLTFECPTAKPGFIGRKIQTLYFLRDGRKLPPPDMSAQPESGPPQPPAEAEVFSTGETKPAATELTPEEQMARFEEDLKESDWGHQPC